MRILFDANVVLDVLLDRVPHARAAALLMAEADGGRIEGVLGATSVTTIYYLLRRAVGPAAARGHVGTLLSVFSVAPVDGDVLRAALQTG